MIVAGIGTALNSLIANTSLLQHISIEAPAHVIGSNTIDSMQSGAVYGTAAMIDGSVTASRTSLGSAPISSPPAVWSREITPHCRRQITYDENLLLEGLRLVYEKNKK